MVYMLIAAAAITAASPSPPRFDLLCKGTNTYIIHGKKEVHSYEDRFSIDLTSKLFSNAEHVSPTPIAELTDSIVFLTREFTGGKITSDLALDRFNSSLSGNTFLNEDSRVVLTADCRVVPFTKWDHRAF